MTSLNLMCAQEDPADTAMRWRELGESNHYFQTLPYLSSGLSSRKQKRNGRPVGTRTPDLYRVNLKAAWLQIATSSD